jgi:hypothetical protein
LFVEREARGRVARRAETAPGGLARAFLGEPAVSNDFGDDLLGPLKAYGHEGSRAADRWMVGKKKAPKRGKRTPIGDRVTFIAMMDKDVIADVKQVAIDEHRAART